MKKSRMIVGIAVIGLLVMAIHAQEPVQTRTAAKGALMKTLSDLWSGLDKLIEAKGNLDTSVKRMEGLLAELSKAAGESARLVGPARQAAAAIKDDGQKKDIEALIAAVERLQKMNQSQHLQVLNLQQEIQRQSRQFQLVSNIMKVKHDTAKSAINNIR